MPRGCALRPAGPGGSGGGGRASPAKMPPLESQARTSRWAVQASPRSQALQLSGQGRGGDGHADLDGEGAELAAQGDPPREVGGPLAVVFGVVVVDLERRAREAAAEPDVGGVAHGAVADVGEELELGGGR